MRGLRSAGATDTVVGGGGAELRDRPDPAGIVTLLACVAAFVGSASLSTWASGTPLQSLIRGAWTPVILAGCLLYALHRDRLAPLVRPALSLLLLALMGASLWQVHTGVHLEAGRIWRAHGWLPHPNDTAIAAILAPILAPWTWPVAAGLILLSGSRTALMGLAVAFLMLTRSWRIRALVIGLAGISLAVFVHAAAVQSLLGRAGAWAVALRMIQTAPWLGMGPQTFVDHYFAWLPATLPFGLTPSLEFMPWAHNLYLEVLAERGLLGLVAVAVPVSLAWGTATRHLRAAIAAFLVMALVDLTFLKPWVAATYWGLVTVSLTGGLPTSGWSVFRVLGWPAGWTYPRQDGWWPNGLGIGLRGWTYFLTWGRGPYLT